MKKPSYLTRLKDTQELLPPPEPHKKTILLALPVPALHGCQKFAPKSIKYIRKSLLSSLGRQLLPWPHLKLWQKLQPLLQLQPAAADAVMNWA